MTDRQEYRRKLRADRIAWGLCTTCGHKLDMKTGTTCRACRDRMNLYKLEHPYKLNESQKAEQLERNRRRIQRLIAAGMCVRCGKPKGITTKRLCDRCRLRENARQREQRRERKAWS